MREEAFRVKQELEFFSNCLAKIKQTAEGMDRINEWRDMEYYGCLTEYELFWDEETSKILRNLDRS